MVELLNFNLLYGILMNYQQESELLKIRNRLVSLTERLIIKKW